MKDISFLFCKFVYINKTNTINTTKTDPPKNENGKNISLPGCYSLKEKQNRLIASAANTVSYGNEDMVACICKKTASNK